MVTYWVGSGHKHDEDQPEDGDAHKLSFAEE